MGPGRMNRAHRALPIWTPIASSLTAISKLNFDELYLLKVEPFKNNLVSFERLFPLLSNSIKTVLIGSRVRKIQPSKGNPILLAFERRGEGGDDIGGQWPMSSPIPPFPLLGSSLYDAPFVSKVRKTGRGGRGAPVCGGPSIGHF